MGGVPLGCSNLGFMYEIGRGVAKDESRAVQLYQKGCDRGDGLGCSVLGNMYADDGRGVPKDDNRAMQLNEKACAGGGSTRLQ